MPEVASFPPGTPNASWITIVICCVEALRRKASDKPFGLKPSSRGKQGDLKRFRSSRPPEPREGLRRRCR